MYLRKYGTKEIFYAMQYNKYTSIEEAKEFISKHLKNNNYKFAGITTEEKSIIIERPNFKDLLLKKWQYLLIDITGRCLIVVDPEAVEMDYEYSDSYDVLYLKLLNEYKDEQMDVAQEELAELIQAISKAKRGKLNKDNLTEELADVKIMTRQVMLYYDIPESAVDEQIRFKLKRTAERYLNHDKN